MIVDRFSGSGGGVHFVGRFEKKIDTGSCVSCSAVKFLHWSKARLEVRMKPNDILSMRLCTYSNSSDPLHLFYVS